MSFRIMVVCTANICRSPVAEVFLRHFLDGKDVQIQSAGTQALDGNPADPAMQILMNTRFPDMSSQLYHHSSRALMGSHLSNSDLILCMEPRHLDWVNQRQPIALGKTKLLTHWNGRQAIDDPIGGSEQEYAKGFEQIWSECQLWSEKIQQLGLCS